MKRVWTLLCAVLGLGCAVMGADAAPAASPDPAPAVSPAAVKAGWTPFQIGFWFEVPRYTSDVYGFKTGWPIVSSDRHLSGLEASWIAGGSDTVRGVQAAGIWVYNNRLEGVESAVFCAVSRGGFRGIQASMGYNQAGKFQGLQAGAVNVTGQFMGLQASALANISGDMDGIQASLGVNIADRVDGFQAGLVNTAERVGGFQAGVINCMVGRGLQIGLINYIRDGWCPFLPFFNYNF